MGANGSVISPGPAPLTSPGLLRPGDLQHRRRPRDRRQTGADREYDYETNTETKNYTYTGTGGVAVGNWLARTVFAAKFAERNFVLQRDRLKQQDPVQP